MIDLFREVRERVTAEDAARHYGLDVDGKGWAVCPFHQDKKPSLHFRNGNFHCFGCGEKGSSIDFAAKLLGLSPVDAVRRLNNDFGLGLHIDRKPTAEEVMEAKRMQEVRVRLAAYERWRQWAVGQLCAYIRTANQALAHISSLEELDNLSENENWCILHREQLDYISDVLSEGTIQEQAEIYRNRGDYRLETKQSARV